MARSIGRIPSGTSFKWKNITLKKGFCCNKTFFERRKGMEMTRSDVIQTILGTINGKRYLEIGVFKRENFNRIITKQKIGVDPSYLHPNRYLSKLFLWFPLLKACHKLLKMKKGEQYFQMTSSRFFEDHASWLSQNAIDVCFIDGLHTYAQSLDDVANCLKYLSNRGAIILHDCCPTSAAMACSAASYEEAEKMDLPGWTGEWCGDVWKTIVYLRSQRHDLRVCVLNTDYGVGIVTRGEPEDMLAYSKEEIDRMTYKDFDSARVKLLNLKDPQYLNNLLTSL
jgi:hypothetical protein